MLVATQLMLELRDLLSQAPDLVLGSSRQAHLRPIIVGVVACFLAGFMPLNVLGELVSMGTLLAFATVCAGVLVLRRTRPELPRPFRVPAASVICPLGVAACLYLFWQPFAEHWKLLVGWTVLGLVIYFTYGYRNSKLNRN